MSKKHPIIAITGSSGAGTTSTSQAFRKIFHQLNIQSGLRYYNTVSASFKAVK